MAPLPRVLAAASYLQLLILSATWLAGIYVNGYVAILPGTSFRAILLNPAVESHVVLATLSAAASVFIVALAVANGSRRAAALSLLATVSIILAGDSGLSFILGGGSDATQSMIMGAAFATSIFLTFLSMASLRSDEGPGSGWTPASRTAGFLCYLSILLFYGVFVSGIYVNLFVAGPVFSLPLASQAAAFSQAASSTPFMAHEALGGALLAVIVGFALSLWTSEAKGIAWAGLVPALLVAYSAYVGSLNLTMPPPAALPAGSALVPLLSSAGTMAATDITMVLALRLRPNRALG